MTFEEVIVTDICVGNNDDQIKYEEGEARVKKKSVLVSFVLMTVMLSLMLTSCAGGNTAKTPGTEAPGKVYELKWGHTSPTSHPYHIAAEKIAEEVLKETNGAVKITVYPSNQLGNQREMTESIQTGVIDVVNSSSSVLSGYIDRVQVCDIPFIFRDREHAYAVFDSEIGEEIVEGIEEVIGPVVAIWENGVRHIFNTKREIRTPADMADMKMRVMESQAFLSMGRHLGTNPTAMAYSELYTALQQGTVDCADNPITAYYGDKFYEVAKYLTLTGHAYSISPVLVSPMLKDKIGEEYYNILIKKIKDYTDYQRQLCIDQEKELLEKLESEAGIAAYVPTAEEQQQFRDACAPIFDEFADVVGRDLINKILEKGK